MLRHLFLCSKNRYLYGKLFIIKELFCAILISLIMENRKMKQKRFCMFNFEIRQ